jgi:alpha-tubulin suppressor-like RCC1 family protein
MNFNSFGRYSIVFSLWVAITLWVFPVPSSYGNPLRFLLNYQASFPGYSGDLPAEYELNRSVYYKVFWNWLFYNADRTTIQDDIQNYYTGELDSISNAASLTQLKSGVSRAIRLQVQEFKRFFDQPPVAANVRGGCAIDLEGELYCWGTNTYGQLDLPSQLGPVVDVSVGVFHTCAVRTNRTVVCWGGILNGTPSAMTDVPSDLGPVHKISAGNRATCVIEFSGKVRCWGHNVPNLSLFNRMTNPARDISVGKEEICGIRGPDQAVYCVTRSISSRGMLHGHERGFSVIAGDTFGCSIQEGGKVNCWGELFKDNQLVRAFVPEKFATGGPLNAVALSGTDYPCVVDSLRRIFCWGYPNATENFAMLAKNVLGFSSGKPDYMITADYDIQPMDFAHQKARKNFYQGTLRRIRPF